jgi:hypothetical protein
MLLLRIRGFLKPVLRNKYLILDTFHPDTLYLRQQGLEDPRLFFEHKRGPRAKKSLRNAVTIILLRSVQNTERLLKF